MRHAVALSVIAVSLLCAGCRPQRKASSSGISVSLLRRGPAPTPGGTDGDALYVMTVLPKRCIRIRDEEVQFEDLADRIAELFSTRVERLLLVRVEGQLEFCDVIEALDRASSRVRLRYALITENTEPTRAEPSLSMDGQRIYTQYFLPREPVPLVHRTPRH